MSRKYTHLKQYEEEILQMKNNGYTRRQIAEKFGIKPEQVHSFTKRHNKKLRNIEAGVLPKKKGRPSKVKSLEDEVLRLGAFVLSAQFGAVHLGRGLFCVYRFPAPSGRNFTPNFARTPCIFL